MNLGEFFRTIREKMVRDPLPPEDVAAGWALGMFVGCSVPFGLQLIVSVPLAMMMRVSKVGATVGTLITNPLTIWIIYPAQTMAMGWLLGRDFSWDYILKAMRGVAKNSDWKTLLSLSGDVVVCFILGGLALAAVLTPITYFTVRTLVRKYRSGRSGNGNRLP
ncbi:MAG: DUF2062 domain-containing protein [Kiritimatiellae bacterium]|nr:DUF2062 domain-containing protein [Kiritimatiellia bacterium]MBR2355313.1 DUF2062 domain-containing protein [Kiritimatiellia bacterium]MBR2939638.1 DUF2062 domain-containing protein [Kiritimatiellia bacterium]